MQNDMLWLLLYNQSITIEEQNFVSCDKHMLLLLSFAVWSAGFWESR